MSQAYGCRRLPQPAPSMASKVPKQMSWLTYVDVLRFLLPALGFLIFFGARESPLLCRRCLAFQRGRAIPRLANTNKRRRFHASSAISTGSGWPGCKFIAESFCSWRRQGHHGVEAAALARLQSFREI